MSKNESNLLFDTLYNKYNKLMLDKKEVANELNISTRTLDRKIKKDEALPKYIKMGGKYLFSIYELSKYLNAISKL